MGLEQPKVFEDWDVDCNDCKHYWDDSCDACSEGSRRLCNSFVATRRVILPARIERLESAIRSLRIDVAILAAMLTITHIGIALGWYP